MKVNKSGTNNPMYEKNHTEETKNKIRKTKHDQFLEKYADKTDLVVELYKSGRTIKEISGIIGTTNNRAIAKLLKHRAVLMATVAYVYQKENSLYHLLEHMI